MTIFFLDKDRDVIPRWRSFEETLAHGELRPVGVGKAPLFDESKLEVAAQLWQDNKTVAFAGELLSTSVMLNRKNASVEEASLFILESDAPASTKDVALKLLGQPTVNPLSEAVISGPSQRIKQLRQYLFVNPKDPFAWVDLALCQTITGHREKTKRAMNVALGLAGDNRFVLRSAARLYVHLNDYDIANDLIRRSEASKHDPWLISAELATSGAANRSPRFAKIGQKLIASSQYSPFHTSELNAALGTLEMEHGRHKKAKKSFVQALIEPTENTVAQVNFAMRRDRNISIDSQELHKITSSEALTYEKYLLGDWSGAIQESQYWLNDQPFSSRPTVLGTYITGSILEDFDKCIEIATLGLIANPRDFGLLNNMAVCMARSGNVDKAIDYFKMIKPDGLENDQKITYIATAGMINYRLGQIELGEQYYQEALKAAKKINNRTLEIRAMLFHCRAKCDSGLPIDKKELDLIEEKINDDDTDSIAIFNNLKKSCESAHGSFSKIITRFSGKD